MSTFGEIMGNSKLSSDSGDLHNHSLLKVGDRVSYTVGP